jgi:cytochrome c oxidase subunit 2
VRFRREAGILAAAVLLLSGCGSKQNALAPESPDARGIATLWWIMLGVSTFGLAVVVALLVASWFRRDREGRERPATVTVVVLGIVVPILVIAALFSYSDIFLIRGTSAPSPTSLVAKRALKITVVGHQFWWEVRYPSGDVVTANEIHIPVRTPVVIGMMNQKIIVIPCTENSSLNSVGPTRCAFGSISCVRIVSASIPPAPKKTSVAQK